MITEHKIPAMPVLEPLSRATQTTFSAVQFLPSDFVEIDLYPDGKHFNVRVVGLEKAPPFLFPSDEAQTITTEDGVWIRNPDRRGYPGYNAIRWANRVPEKEELAYGHWKMATTDFTALVIHHVWPVEKLIWLSEEAFLTYLVLLKRFLLQTKAAETIAQWNLNRGMAPEMPKDYVEHPELPLGPYQKAALLASLSQFSYALFMQQGCGKTPVVIARTCFEGRRKMKGQLPGRPKGMYRALIICPLQVRRNWENEYCRFATVPGKVGALRGGKLRKIKELIDSVRTEEGCSWSATILSIDSVYSMWEVLRKIKWDLIVVDESHKMKSRSSRRFKTMQRFTENHCYAKMILTGTPIANTIFDLWSQFEWLGPGLSGFRSYPAFKRFHGKWEHRNGQNILTGYKAVPLLQERLARLSFVISKKEAGLQLPEKVYDIYEVEMTPEQRQIYKDIANKLVVEINSILNTSTDASLTVNHILTKLLRLAQVCSGFVTTDEKIDLDTLEVQGRENLQIPPRNPKLDGVIEMLKDDHANDPNSKAIIWACFVEDLRAISERLHKEGINHVGYHRAIRKEYRAASAEDAEVLINTDPNCRVIVANPASAGVGLNFLGYDWRNPEKFDTYVDHEIYFSCNWNAVDRSQSEDRAHRRGTRTNVRITDLTVLNTIDEEIRNRVKYKQDVAATVQDIRTILENIAGGY